MEMFQYVKELSSTREAVAAKAQETAKAVDALHAASSLEAVKAAAVAVADRVAEFNRLVRDHLDAEARFFGAVARDLAAPEALPDTNKPAARKFDS
jgi:hypothetical protein